MRVLTWNLWWRFGPWEERRQAIEAVLAEEDPDVVCLQEVWAHEAGEDQVLQLAESLGLHHARTASNFFDGLSFGNAVLSRWPVIGQDEWPLPREDGTPSHRSALLARIDHPAGVLRVISTHLDYRFDGSARRVAQATALASFVAMVRGDPDSELPVVIGADLNAVPDSDEIRMLTGRSAPPVENLIFTDAWEVAGDGTAGLTWSSENEYLADATWPNRRLDYVLVSWPRPDGIGTPSGCWLAGVEPVDGVQPSDHFAVVADLRWPED